MNTPQTVGRAADTEKFITQVGSTVRELQHLRTKSDNDDKMILLLRQQRDEAQRELEGVNRKHAIAMERQRIDLEDQLTAAINRCNEALEREAQVEAILQETSSYLLQALRRREGDKTEPQRMPLDPNAPEWQKLLDSTLEQGDHG